MRESRTYGSVRGAGSNLRPYRDRSVIRGRPIPDDAVLHSGYELPQVLPYLRMEPLRRQAADERT
jgi:hypothetical protein